MNIIDFGGFQLRIPEVPIFSYIYSVADKIDVKALTVNSGRYWKVIFGF